MKLNQSLTYQCRGVVSGLRLKWMECGKKSLCWAKFKCYKNKSNNNVNSIRIHKRLKME